MLSRYRGRVGHYLWQMDRQRLRRYKDRPWELQSKDTNGSAFLAMIFLLAVAFGGMTLISMF